MRRNKWVPKMTLERTQKKDAGKKEHENGNDRRQILKGLVLTSWVKSDHLEMLSGHFMKSSASWALERASAEDLQIEQVSIPRNTCIFLIMKCGCRVRPSDICLEFYW